MKVFEAVGNCSYRRADSIRDRRPTADYRMRIHPQLANVDLAVYGDLAVGRVVILNNPPVTFDPFFLPRSTIKTVKRWRHLTLIRDLTRARRRVSLRSSHVSSLYLSPLN